MQIPDPIAFVVDDDEAVRDSLGMLLRSIGLEVRTFASAQEFLNSHDPAQPGCLILDVRMPGMSGLDLQQRLNELGSTLPIIFITGHADVSIAVSAMRSGAVDFVQKPFHDQELLDRVQQSIEANTRVHAKLRNENVLRERLARLTPRERQVMEMVVGGAPNKAIAFDLELSERTVEIHRSRVMKKMEAGSLPELVQMVVKIQE